MFGVRIAILVVSLLGVAALLPLDAAEARTRDAYQGSYSKYLPSSSREVLRPASPQIHRALLLPQIDRP